MVLCWQEGSISNQTSCGALLVHHGDIKRPRGCSDTCLFDGNIHLAAETVMSLNCFRTRDKEAFDVTRHLSCQCS